MPDTAIPLYTDRDLRQLRFWRRFWTWALPVLLVLALGAIIGLIVTVNRRNELRHELIAICISTLAGWITIYFSTFSIRGGKRELQHAETLSDGVPEVLRGRVRLTKERFRIRGSIALRKLEVETPDGVRRVSINATKVKRIKKAGEHLVLYVVHGYVAAYERLT